MATENKRKLAVVTGASSGIGLQLARQCLAHDFDVLVCAEDAAIESIAGQLTAPGADGKPLTGQVMPVRADLATYDGVEHLYAAIRSHRRPVDALLLNAGTGLGGEFAKTDLTEELKMIALNCMHTVHLAKRVIPDMVARGEGKILMTGSVVSTTPNPYQAVYAATKAFVMSLGEALRYELKDS
ncbi:MAG TPA: SDR family NAD(P)-dependent oxidoreductase, partial [Kofleriaceae bacterium]